jgi:hypothetical protein
MGLLSFASSAGGGALLGGIASGLFGRKQAKDQTAFQKAQSDTAHQREVKDLRKAGLNPILSGTGGGGASTPSGAMTTVDPVSSAMGVRRLAAELKKIEADTNTAYAQEHKISNESKLLQYQQNEYKAASQLWHDIGQGGSSAKFILQMRQLLKK